MLLIFLVCPVRVLLLNPKFAVSLRCSFSICGFHSLTKGPVDRAPSETRCRPQSLDQISAKDLHEQELQEEPCNTHPAG